MSWSQTPKMIRLTSKCANKIRTSVNDCALQMADLASSDAVEEVGQEQEGMPEGADAVPGRGHTVLAVAQDDWLHRRAGQERPRLEGQQAHPICGGPLHHMDTVSSTNEARMFGDIDNCQTSLKCEIGCPPNFRACEGGGEASAHLWEQKQWPGCGRKLPSSRQLHPLLYLS